MDSVSTVIAKGARFPRGGWKHLNSQIGLE
jgi:hypothetical protein